MLICCIFIALLLYDPWKMLYLRCVFHGIRFKVNSCAGSRETPGTMSISVGACTYKQAWFLQKLIKWFNFATI